jgi:site-specific DNA-methyltransferase (adenine-specific)
VGTESTLTVRNGNSGAHGRYGKDDRVFTRENPPGRWPANLIHDGSDEPTGLLGDAARFFYCAKASRADRGAGNVHPTVKPTDLMRYLCRLVTPPGGVVLDPFAGSGSTGKAAVLEGFRFLGIEREAEYVEIARARIASAEDKASQPRQAALFQEAKA